MPKKIDLSGMNFSRLTVVSEAGRDTKGNIRWSCACECGGTIVTTGRRLRNGETRSCGCIHREEMAARSRPNGSRRGLRADLTGQAFGRLTVVGYEGRTGDGRPLWSCQCSCGTETVVRGSALTTGHTASCGCLKGETLMARAVTHGESGTALYRRWHAMWDRVGGVNHSSYSNYGGRGITICDRWKSYENFRDDMGPSFRADLTLERVDVEGPYSPDNCVWASAKDQANNTRRNRFLTAWGQTKTIAQWADILGLNPGTIQSRLAKSGWSVEKSLVTNADPAALAEISQGAFKDPS